MFSKLRLFFILIFFFFSSIVVAQEESILIKTDSYEILFSLTGGVPVRWDITDPRYAVEIKDRDSSRFTPDGRIYLANRELEKFDLAKHFGLILSHQENVLSQELNQQNYSLTQKEETDEFHLDFELFLNSPGLRIIKSYRIPKKGFLSTFTLTFVNESGSSLSLKEWGFQIGPGLGYPPENTSGVGSGLYSFVEPVYTNTEETSSWDWEEMEEEPQELPGILYWVGLHSRYFMLSVSPHKGLLRVVPELDEGVKNKANLSEEEWLYYPRLDLLGEPFSLEAGESREFLFKIFAGPKDLPSLEPPNENYEDVLFHYLWNWMRWICFLLMDLLDLFFGYVHDWGLSIILLAVAIRIVTFPLAQIGLKYQNEANETQAKLQPFIKEIKEKHKGDPAKESQAILALYKEHGASPFAAFKGLIWVLIQVPIFIALFNLLGLAVELRGAGFLWIDDLSLPDRLFSLGVRLPFFGEYFNFLPVLMSISTVLTTLASPTSKDKKANRRHQLIMFVMALVFFLLFYSFPAGLVLYWFLANLGQLIQQKLMKKFSSAKK